MPTLHSPEEFHEGTTAFQARTSRGGRLILYRNGLGEPAPRALTSATASGLRFWAIDDPVVKLEGPAVWDSADARALLDAAAGARPASPAKG